MEIIIFDEIGNLASDRKLNSICHSIKKPISYATNTIEWNASMC